MKKKSKQCTICGERFDVRGFPTHAKTHSQKEVKPNETTETKTVIVSGDHGVLIHHDGTMEDVYIRKI